jgi:hypothetical protein
MIKRLRFVTMRSGLAVHDFAKAWVGAVGLVRGAPAELRPIRAVACTTLRDVAGTDAPHDGVGIEWFVDLASLQRFESWLASAAGSTVAGADSVVSPDATVVVVAEELVMRGADWLVQRWLHGVPKLKHMALARRAPGLSPAEFTERWRNRPGVVGAAGAAAPLAIPERERGHAYVQNHPLPSASVPSRYDAINEVYFDDLDALRSRIDFFQLHDVRRRDADLVGGASFLAVEEHVIADGSLQRGGRL